MTDITPTPQPASSPVPTISLEEVRELERKCRENRAAQLRGEAPLYDVTPKQLRDAIIAIRQQRGTMNIAGESKKATSSKKSPPITIDLEGLEDM